MSKKVFKFIIAALILGSAIYGGVYFFGPHHNAEASEEGGAHGQPQAMEVDVSVIAPQKIQLWKKFSGHVVAVNQAEIRPQVSGRITDVKFEDGQRVEKGDTLIVIDPRPYEAKLAQAQAALASAITEVDLADKEYQRAAKLIQTDSISQSTLDERTNRRKAAAAAVEGARAAVKSAKIDLDYAYLKAPISGKISRAEITEGNLVQAGPNAPLLTSIVADERVYIDFEVDERTYIKSVNNSAETSETSDTPVRLQLLNSDREYVGKLHSFDNRIDQSSGTIRARAIFENSDGLLLPGMTVTVLMGGMDNADTILVTERAIGTDQDRKFVYVVKDDNTAEYREVKIGQSVSGQRVIMDGLQSGEQVITDGLVRIRPGMPVSPKAQLAQTTTDIKTTDMPAEDILTDTAPDEIHEDINEDINEKE